MCQMVLTRFQIGWMFKGCTLTDILYFFQVDKLLDELAAVSKEDEQLKVLKKIAKR